jgi:alpha-tubulin suppressor-like RCC1 family protein
LLADTSIKCWGYNASGQLGNYTTDNSNTAVTLGFEITGATSVSAGRAHSCALFADTTVKCWGNNDYGQLGNGTNTRFLFPTLTSGLTGATAISAGYFHSCALFADSTVKCWGYNVYGGLGNGTNTDSNTPVSVIGL